MAQGGEWFSSLTTCVPNPCGQAYIIEPDGSGAYPTIQAGVNASFDGDTLILGEGTFVGTGNRDIDILGKELVIRSRLDDPALCGSTASGSAAASCSPTARTPLRFYKV